jgi:ribonucleoside-diphosphate reductase alpha chain
MNARPVETVSVIKRNGATEPLDIDKIHRQVMWATEGISGVSPSEVEIKSQLQFYNGIRTLDIQETLIKAAADLIELESPNYQYVAARLINHHIRKDVYNSFLPCSLREHVTRVVEAGFYTPELLQWYSTEEFDILDTYVDHNRDFDFTLAAMEQWRGKYLVKNRVTDQIYETPQMAYMLIAATLFHNYPSKTRLKWVKEYYDAISLHDVSLPTPVMAGVRTPQKQFSSCVLIETDDSLDSISAVSHAIIRYVSRKAGIGLNFGRIRAKNSPIRNGDAYHTGVVPFIKHFQTAVRSSNQGGVRGGAATAYFPFWHLEFEDLVVLKNNKGTEETRARHLDYSVQFNKLAYERLLAGGNLTLFSPSDVPGLYDAFFVDQDEFKRLYEKYEADPKIRKKTLKAFDLFAMFMQERKNTGRVYFMNVDHANTHSSFIEDKATIRQSNLCAEVLLPTMPLQSIDDTNPAVALCTLSAINWGKIREPKDFEKPCRLAVRALDELLDYQEYPLLAAEAHTKKFRPLGVGIINLAYWIAKMGFRYSDDSSLMTLDEYAEAWSYYMIRASVDLAREKGACEGHQLLKYSQGLVPLDTRKKDVDQLVPHQERLPWDQLRADLQTYGIRNSTLLACMPSEASSLISNSTNGIEPPRSLISIKQNKHFVIKQVVPEYRRLKNKYELLWDQKSPEGYLKICAVLQKYMDQTISTNTSYNPAHYDGGKVPMSELLRHMVLMYKWGLKTAYYDNTNDGAGEMAVDELIELPAGEKQEEQECESCVL